MHLALKTCNIGVWCNGSIPVSKTVDGGSNPSAPARGLQLYPKTTNYFGMRGRRLIGPTTQLVELSAERLWGTPEKGSAGRVVPSKIFT